MEDTRPNVVQDSDGNSVQERGAVPLRPAEKRPMLLAQLQKAMGSTLGPDTPFSLRDLDVTGVPACSPVMRHRGQVLSVTDRERWICNGVSCCCSGSLHTFMPASMQRCPFTQASFSRCLKSRKCGEKPLRSCLQCGLCARAHRASPWRKCCRHC